MTSRRLSALTLALALGFMARDGRGDARQDEARKLAAEGKAALEQRDFATALDRFARAETMINAPTVMLGHARALAGVGKLLAARAKYDEVRAYPAGSDSPAAFERALEAAASERAEVDRNIPRVVVFSRGVVPSTFTVDGKAVPIASLGLPVDVDPGPHVIELVAPSGASRRREVDAKVGLTAQLVLTFDEPRAGLPPPGPDPAAPYTVAGVVGIVLGGSGAVATAVLVALGSYSENPRTQSDATAAAIGVGIASGVVLLTGIGLVVLPPRLLAKPPAKAAAGDDSRRAARAAAPRKATPMAGPPGLTLGLGAGGAPGLSLSLRY